MVFQLAADIVLAMHVTFVLFVVLGFFAIVVGKFFHWRWVYNLRFRVIHLLAIAVVVLQAWLGLVCPLTVVEMKLRAAAGGATYPGAFVAHWLEAILYFNAPPWVFVIVYSVFGALVLLTWFWVRPRQRKADQDATQPDR